MHVSHDVINQSFSRRFACDVDTFYSSYNKLPNISSGCPNECFLKLYSLVGSTQITVGSGWTFY